MSLAWAGDVDGILFPRLCKAVADNSGYSDKCNEEDGAGGHQELFDICAWLPLR